MHICKQNSALMLLVKVTYLMKQFGTEHVTEKLVCAFVHWVDESDSINISFLQLLVVS